MEKRKILITGASGNIGSKLCSAFRERYDLILLDKKKRSIENIKIADLKEYDDNWVKLFENVSSVIHLAGNPYTNARWDELIPDNIDSVLNVCQACVERGVERLVFTSSCHTMGGYRNKDIDLITPDMAPLPDCDYGISKLVGERICKSFSERFPLSVVCLRIGWVPRSGKKPGKETEPWSRNLWLSEKDMIQIFEKSIEVKNVKFKILYAMSSNRGMNWDLRTTMETLGYEPQNGMK